MQLMFPKIDAVWSHGEIQSNNWNICDRSTQETPFIDFIDFTI